MTRDRLLVLPVLEAACLPAVAPEASSETSSTASTGGATTSVDSDTMQSSDTAVPADLDVPASPCGNGVVDPGELCDDGDLLDDAECDAACRVPRAERWRMAITELGGNCPRVAPLADGALALAGPGLHAEAFGQWSTVVTIVLDASGRRRAIVESPVASGYRDVLALASTSAGFVALGQQSDGRSAYSFLQRWSVDAVADAELPLDDLSGFSGVEAMAQAPDDRLWVVDEAQGQWRLSLRGVTDTSATWSAELDPPGPFDIFYSGFRVAADDDALYLRTPALEAMLQRWSGEGELLWAIAWDGERDPMPFFTGLAVAPGGDAVTVGRFTGAPWVRRHDRDGVMRWSSTIDVGPQAGRDYPYDVIVDPDGGIVVAGEARVVDPAGDSWQVWLAGYSTDGEELWQRRYVPEDPDGGFTHVCALARGTIADAPIYLAALGSDGLSIVAYE